MPGVLGQGLNGIRVETPDNLLLDGGIAYIGIDESKLALAAGDAIDQAIANAFAIGATKDNASFSSGKEVHEVAVNGARYPLKGMKRIDAYAPTLTLTFIEHTEANLKNILANYKVTPHPQFNEFELDVEIVDADYLPNVALLAKLSGKETPVLLVLRNCMTVNEFGLTLEDKNEAGTEAQFLAHATLAAPHDSPFALYYPTTVAS